MPAMPGVLKPRPERVVAALDVGTSKVSAAVAIIDGATPAVLGAATRACAGLRRGLVADMERTEAAIRAAMAEAERAAGVEAGQALVAMSAGDLEAGAVAAEVAIGGHRIEDADVTKVLAEAQARMAAATRPGRAMLHALPTLYTIDGLDGVTNPRGFHANRLAVELCTISADTPPCRNLDLAVRNAHLGVEALVASGLAASLAVLTPEERELGVACVEMGAGVTTVTVHGGGMLLGLETIAMGAGDVTTDIAAAFATRRSVAERLKIVRGSAQTAPRDSHDMLEVAGADDEAEPRRVTRAELVAVIRRRVQAWAREVDAALTRQGFTGTAGRQVVLTGGGAELSGIAAFTAGVLARNVRVGRPRGLDGLPDTMTNAASATLAGLLLYAAQPRLDLTRRPMEAKRGDEATGRVGKLMGYLRKRM